MSSDPGLEVELEVEVIATTDRAILCEIEGYEHWIPRKLISEEGDISDQSTNGDIGTVVIPEWFAIKEKII